MSGGGWDGVNPSIKAYVLHPLRDMRAEGGAAIEGASADAGEAIRQAGQREGGAAAEGVAADAGEAVG